MSAVFSLEKFRNRQFYFILTSETGERLIISDRFVFKVTCQQAINTVRLNASREVNYQQGISTDNKYFFVLREPNGDIIATSEMYLLADDRDRAMKKVQLEALHAGYIDHTLVEA